MNIILNAFYCDPTKGSEAAVGWNWLVGIAQKHSVYLLFFDGKSQKNNIQHAVSLLEKKADIHLIPISIPKLLWNKFTYRIGYEVFNHKAIKEVQKLLSSGIKVDILHHVTIATWWNIAAWYKLELNYLIGPLLGGQKTNNAVISLLPIRYRLNEHLRNYLFFFLWGIIKYKNKIIKNSKAVFCGNSSTFKVIAAKRNIKPILLSTTGIHERIDSNNDNKKSNDKPIRLLFVGQLIPIKNLNFLINILNRIDKNIDWNLDIIGDGPLRKDLEIKVKNNNLSNRISFYGKIQYSEVNKYYANADIFVFPSIREGAPTVILEAMLNKLPCIVLDLTGMNDFIDESCGIKVKVENKEQIFRDFANAIEILANNKKLRLKMGENAFHKVNQNFTWPPKIEFVEKYYQKHS